MDSDMMQVTAHASKKNGAQKKRKRKQKNVSRNEFDLGTDEFLLESSTKTLNYE